jgi:3-hydroxyisobutyrate dehydrogenase-like beta-hydroxyacid dehydrogenase
MDVGFVGLGNMGRHMARNLLEAGHAVTAFNRTRSRAEELAADGATVADSIAEACAPGILITVVSDDAAVEDVVYRDGGALAALAKGAIHVSMSTISRDMSERLAADHAAAEQVYVAAPVFGRVDFAEAGRLLIGAAGPAAAIEHCQPLFDAMGRRTVALGETASAANVVKLSVNVLVGLAIQGMAETFTVIRKSGGDAAAFCEVIGEVLPAPQYVAYGGMIANDSYEPPGFRLELGLKDVRLALAAADAVGVAMPTTSILRDQHLAAVARGYGGLDWAALAKLAADMAGES